MYIVLNNVDARNTRTKARILYSAMLYIKQRPIYPAEYSLNKYLLDNYNLNLTQASLLVLDRSKLQASTADKLLITFMDPRYSRLGDIISYGNGTFKGSTIFQEAFKGWR